MLARRVKLYSYDDYCFAMVHLHRLPSCFSQVVNDKITLYSLEHRSVVVEMLCLNENQPSKR